MHNRQSGNILFLILIAVAIFAALSYAVTSSSRTGSKNASSENASTIASSMLQYGTMVSQTIDRLHLINNCADTQLSFENSIATIYTNSSAQSKCKLFDKAGGSLPWQSPPSQASISNQPYFFTTTPVSNVGAMPETPSTRCFDITDDTEFAKCTDIVMILFDLPLPICNAINSMIDSSYNISGPVPGETGVDNLGSPFTGSLTHLYDDIGYPTSAYPEYFFSGKNFGCYKEANASSVIYGKYVFYYVVKAN